MKKLKLKSLIALSAIFIGGLIISCENEAVETNQKVDLYEGLSPEVVSKIKEVERIIPDVDWPNIGYKNARELVLSGAEVWEHKATNEEKQKMSDLDKKIKINSPKSASKASSQRLTILQLRQIGWLNDTQIVDQLLTNGLRPKGFSIDNYASRGGKGSLPNDYNWRADVTVGDAYLTNESPLTTLPSIMYSTTGKNFDYRSVDVAELAFSMAVTKEKNWNVTGSISFTVGGQVGIPFVAAGYVETSIGLSAGGGGSNTESIQVNRRYEAQIQPRTQRLLAFFQSNKRATAVYHVPVRLTGVIATNFERRNAGSYFWAVDASKLQRGNEEVVGNQTYVQKENDGYFVAYASVPVQGPF
jgi:hypothetical protein